MSDEIRDLTKLCYQTQTDIEVLKTNHKTLFIRIEEIRKQLEETKEENKGNYKVWHLAVITVIYAVISMLPHDKIFDMLFR